MKYPLAPANGAYFVPDRHSSYPQIIGSKRKELAPRDMSNIFLVSISHSHSNEEFP
jgi:hypothetical protein